MRYSKDLEIKAADYDQSFVNERDSSYYSDELQYNPDENRSLAASYDVTPKRKSHLPGQNGEGVVIPFYRMREEKEGYKLHGFNCLASDMIPLERRLKDYRKIE